MPLKFETNTETFLAVLSLVLGADNIGSIEERNFLLEKVKGVPIFGALGSKDLSALLAKVTDAVFTQLPQVDGAVSPAGVDALLADAKASLAPDLRKTLVEISVGLMESDGVDDAEQVLVEKIRRALG